MDKLEKEKLENYFIQLVTAKAEDTAFKKFKKKYDNNLTIDSIDARKIYYKSINKKTSQNFYTTQRDLVEEYTKEVRTEAQNILGKIVKHIDEPKLKRILNL
jgi:ribosomal protein S21